MSQYFEPEAAFAISYRKRLPHWSQPGVIAFITWRTSDSLPISILNRWREERDTWLNTKGIDPDDNPDWPFEFDSLPFEQKKYFHANFTKRWHDELDRGHGSCVLKHPAYSKIVAESLLFFHEDRYVMEDFVIMPNHVHLLAAFPSHEAMLKQCESWKRFTARQINKRIGNQGRFWQKDAFDHLVRNEKQLERLKEYLRQNPVKARLKNGEYRLMDHHAPREM